MASARPAGHPKRRAGHVKEAPGASASGLQSGFEQSYDPVMAVKLFRATRCPGCGQPYVGGKVTLGWTACACPGARLGGHIRARCWREGCTHEHWEGHVGPPPDDGRMPPLGRT